MDAKKCYNDTQAKDGLQPKTKTPGTSWGGTPPPSCFHGTRFRPPLGHPCLTRIDRSHSLFEIRTGSSHNRD